MNALLDPVPQVALRVVLAAIFAWSAAHKLRGPRQYRAALAGYELLPHLWVTPAAVAVCAAEIGAVIALLAWYDNPTAGLLAAALLGVYAVAIAVNLRRGRRDIDCGCAGPAQRVGLSEWLVGRNALLAGAALLTTLPVRARPLLWLDVCTACAMIVVLLLLYAAADGLLATVTRMSVSREAARA